MNEDVPLIEYWYQALSAEFGVKVLVVEGSIEQLRSRLYYERKRANDPALSVLTLVSSQNNPNEVWICHSAKLSGTDETA